MLAAPAVVQLALLLLVAGGCDSNKPPPAALAPTPTLPLRVLVVDDPELAAVVDREWNSRPGGQCRIKQMTTDELLGLGEGRLGADVVIYPSGLLGELAERGLIDPLSSDDAQEPMFGRGDIFASLRFHEISWGKDVYAVPFGSPQFTLLYRKDIFAALGLEPPTTWSAYQELAARLANREAIGDAAPPDEQAWYGVAEPHATGWAGALLLARAAAYARHRNQYSTLFDFTSADPLIAGPPFVRALDELRAVAEFGPETALSPTEARRLFLAGQCAMAITWPSRADDASAEARLDREDWIGCAELPGSPDVYNLRAKSWEQRADDESPHVTLLALAGRLGSVTEESRRPKQALAMLFLLAGEEIGSLIASTSKHTTLFRDSQMGDVSQWVDDDFDGAAARDYAAAVQAAQSRSAWLSAIRIPGRARYLAALDQAVATTIAGDAPSADALQAAAESWRAITAELGPDQQRPAYMRSLGLKP